MASSFLFKRIDAQHLGPNAHSYLQAYYTLHFVPGHVFLPILLGIFLFSGKVKRHPTLYNVVISYIVSSVCACILLYAGETSGPEPSLTLCIAQTGLLNGVPPMWAISALMLTFYIWGRFYGTKKGSPDGSMVLRILMLVAPYMAFVGWSLAAFYVSYMHQDLVNRDRRYFYCSIHLDSFANSMSLFSATACFLTTLLEIHLAFLLYRNWRVLRAAGQSGGVDIAFILRTFVFGLSVVAGLIISVTGLWNPTTAITDLYGATIGWFVVLVFGSQADVLRVLCFWRTSVQTSSTSSQELALPPQGEYKEPYIDFSNPWDPEMKRVEYGSYDGKVSADASTLKGSHRVTIIARPSDAFVSGSAKV